MRFLLPLLIGCQAEPETATHETLPLAEALAAEGVARWAPESIPLGWSETVWAYGVHRVYAATGEVAWRDYYRAWMVDVLPEFTDEDPRAFGASDEMAPAIIASTVMLETGEHTFTPITDAGHAWLDEAPRTAEGAIVHWGPDSALGDTRQVWVDSMFMFGVFLVREYQRTGEGAYLERFLEQYGLFSQLCRDPATDLYRHAYDDLTGENIPEEAVFWARGNSWVLIAAAELLTVLGPDAPEVQELLPLFQSHAEALADAQAADGLWNTVLGDPYDDPDNYTETSASALIGYGLVLGVRSGALTGEGWLETISRAATGLQGRIEDRGDELVVEDISFGTNPGDYDYYVSVPLLEDTNMGVGAALMMLAEVDGLEDPLGGEGG
jgi:unsaturated rhamnogalacturonyl hydrolase